MDHYRETDKHKNNLMKKFWVQTGILKIQIQRRRIQ